MKKTFIFVIILMIQTGYAQESDFFFTGYVKYLPSIVRHPETGFSLPGFPDLSGKSLKDQLIHFRLNSKWYINESFTGALEFRARAIQGDSPEKISNYKELYFASDYEYDALELFLWEKPRSIGHTQIDRLWLDYYHDNFQATVGRQRVAWGTSLVWNITDLFNPMDIIDFDYEERPGSDALRIQYYTGPVSKFDLVIKPGKSKKSSTIALAWAYNLYDFDTFILAGIKNDLWTIGGNWAGDIFGGGFRGEFLLTEALSNASPWQERPLLPWLDSFYDDDKTNFSFVLSGDYTFSNSFYIHTEVMHNSNGRTKNLGLLAFDALSAGMLSPARWSLFQEFSYDITPLIRGSIYGFYNPDDQSSLLVPSLNWSVISNLDLMLIFFQSEGKILSEFSSYGSAGYVRLKYAF